MVGLLAGNPREHSVCAPAYSIERQCVWRALRSYVISRNVPKCYSPCYQPEAYLSGNTAVALVCKEVPILIPPAPLATWRAYAAETDVASLCGREATSAGNLARSVCSRIDWLVQLPPNEGGRKTVCSECTRAMFQGAGREKTLRCRSWSLRAVRSARDSGGSSNQRTNLRASLQGAADHCAQLDRLLSGRSYRWKFHR